MFIRTLDELEKLGRIGFPVKDTVRSARFPAAADGMGYPDNENRVTEGTDMDDCLLRDSRSRSSTSC